jgi:hypothetical protein
MKINCFICKNELDIADSYAYIGKDRKYRKAEKADFENVPEHIINTSSKTDVIFVCEACYKEKSGD